MKIIKTINQDYELIDLKDGYKYERIGGVLIKRPDSNAKGTLNNPNIEQQLDAEYVGEVGKGNFITHRDLQDNWMVNMNDMHLRIKPSSYKHIGLFPEQKVHWDYVKDKIEASDKPVKVLNLFAYTGAATINAALAGASEVVHVEALKQLNNWAQENSKLSNADHLNIRYFQDDVISFLKREIKRGNKYQIIIMDPPSFGRGPKQQIWKFQDNIDELLSLSAQLLDDPLCLIISTYTPTVNKDALSHTLHKHFHTADIETYAMVLEAVNNKRLYCGVGGTINFK